MARGSPLPGASRPAQESNCLRRIRSPECSVAPASPPVERVHYILEQAVEQLVPLFVSTLLCSCPRSCSLVDAHSSHGSGQCDGVWSKAQNLMAINPVHVSLLPSGSNARSF